MAGNFPVSASASDNSAIASVEFLVDGEAAAPPVEKPPYTVSINSWRLANGEHTLSVVGYDAFGNSGSAKQTIMVRNDGIMPAVPDRIVYDDGLRVPFSNTSWGAIVNLDDRVNPRTGTSAAAVDYMAWGAFDLLSGTWGATAGIDPSEFDTLKADIYPLNAMSMKVAFYNNVSVEISLRPNEWNSVAIPLTFSQPFNRFYFQSNLSQPAKCYFDNIRFSAKRYSTAASR